MVQFIEKQEADKILKLCIDRRKYLYYIQHNYGHSVFNFCYITNKDPIDAFCPVFVKIPVGIEFPDTNFDSQEIF